MSSLSINTSFNALSNKRRTQDSSKSSSDRLEKLASGLDVNTASDEASGVAVSETLSSNVRSGAQALQELQDGISLLQTAEGGTERIQENLREIRRMAAETANESGGGENRDSIQEDVQNLTGEIDRIAEETNFNAENLLNGEIAEGTQIQAGPDQGDTIEFSVSDLSAESLGIDELDLTSEDGAEQALDSVNGALNQVATEQAGIDSTVERLESTVDSGLIQRENEQAAQSELRDANLAREATENAQDSLLSQAGTSTLAQASDLEGSSALNLLQ